MYTQAFGNYLLNTSAVTSEQLLAALSAQATAHVNLGTLAVHRGYMTAVETEHVFILQTHRDKLFGEIAVEEGYLTQEQVSELLKCQAPGYVVLGQILVDQGILTPAKLQNIITDYRSEYEIYELEDNDEQSDLVHHLLAELDKTEEKEHIHPEYVSEYLLLLFNNLIRFIGEDFTPLNIIQVPEVPTDCCIAQSLGCTDFHVSSALDMDTASAIAFASRYAKDEFQEYDEYVQASMEDFLNLHNGLFVVNMSNDYNQEVKLQPPSEESNSLFSAGKITYIFPILYPFGLIHFICSISDEG